MDKAPCRLQNFLARRGCASRRGAAAMVSSGRVSVNGSVVTEPGFRLDPLTARVLVDGKPLPRHPEPKRTILLHKPPGIICSADSRQGRTVLDLLPPRRQRLVPAGRLDKDSEGLVVLSNDGELIQRLTHPGHRQGKKYRAWVAGEVNNMVVERLRQPMAIGGARTRPAGVSLLRPTKTGAVLEFRLGEGRNRQIRRLCERSGLRVERLVRVAIAGLTLEGLSPGEWRELTRQELDKLFRGSSGQPAKPSGKGSGNPGQAKRQGEQGKRRQRGGIEREENGKTAGQPSQGQQD